jgi:hypothetical protein
MSSLGMAPQLIAAKALPARTPSSWMARATSSLPDPDGPHSMTEAFDRATRRIISRSWLTAGLLPMINASSAALLPLFCPTSVIFVSMAPPMAPFR